MKKEYIKPITTIYNISTETMMVVQSEGNGIQLTKERNDFEEDLEEIGDSWGKNGFWNN